MDIERLLPKSVDAAVAIKPDEKRKKSTCTCCKVFLYATLGVIGFTILAGVCAYRSLRREVIRFTVPNPISLQVEVMEESECEVEKDRIKMFFDMLIAGDEPDMDLSVSAAAINGCFIGQSDYLRGNAFVTLEDNNLHIDMSLPAYFLPGGYHRYFVAQAELDLVPPVTHYVPNSGTSFTFEMEPLTPVEGITNPLMKADVDVFEDEDGKFEFLLRYGKFANWISHNLVNDGMYDDPNIASILRGVKGLSIQDNMITIRARHGNPGVVDTEIPGIIPSMWEQVNAEKDKTSNYDALTSVGSYGVRRLFGIS